MDVTKAQSCELNASAHPLQMCLASSASKHRNNRAQYFIVRNTVHFLYTNTCKDANTPPSINTMYALYTRRVKMFCTQRMEETAAFCACIECVCSKFTSTHECCTFIHCTSFVPVDTMWTKRDMPRFIRNEHSAEYGLNCAISVLIIRYIVWYKIYVYSFSWSLIANTYITVGVRVPV